MKRMSALTSHGSLAMCLVCALAHSEWPAGSHPKPCPETQPHSQQIFYISLTRVVSLGSPTPEDRLRKQLAFPAPEVEARKKSGERGVGKHPWVRQSGSPDSWLCPCAGWASQPRLRPCPPFQGQWSKGKKQGPGRWHLKTGLHHGTVTCWLLLRENCHLISLNSVPSSVDEDQSYPLQSVEVNERMDGQNRRWIVSFYYHASYFITKQKQVGSSHHWINGETLVNPCASTKQIGKFVTSQTSKALLKLLSFWKKKEMTQNHNFRRYLAPSEWHKPTWS